MKIFVTSPKVAVKEGFTMKNQVMVETSARHVHVSKQDLEILFGAGYELTV